MIDYKSEYEKMAAYWNSLPGSKLLRTIDAYAITLCTCKIKSPDRTFRGERIHDECGFPYHEKQ